MVTFVSLNIKVEFDNTGTPTGNWIGEGFRGTGMTAAAAGNITNNKVASGGETDSHVWVAISCYFDRDAFNHPLYLASGATFTCFVVPTQTGKWNSITLTRS